MKVRCIERYCYMTDKSDFKFAREGEIYNTNGDGITERIYDKFGVYIISLDDERFFKHFEFLDETPEEYIPFDGSEETEYSFIRETLINISKLIEKKNTDYGDSYTKTRDKYGHKAFLIRLSDKINRYEQLIQNEKLVDDESLIDTLKDIIGYAALEIEYLEVNEERKENV